MKIFSNDRKTPKLIYLPLILVTITFLMLIKCNGFTRLVIGNLIMMPFPNSIFATSEYNERIIIKCFSKNIKRHPLICEPSSIYIQHKFTKYPSLVAHYIIYIVIVKFNYHLLNDSIPGSMRPRSYSIVIQKLDPVDQHIGNKIFE